MSEWQWARIGDPASPAKVQAHAPSGQLRDAGATVTAFEADFPRLSLCPVCEQLPVQWLAHMTLPAPVSTLLPTGRGCTPDHAAAGAPTSWAAVAQRLERDSAQRRTQLATDDGFAAEQVVHLLTRQAAACAFLASATPQVQRRALALWAEDPDLPVAHVAASASSGDGEGHQPA